MIIPCINRQRKIEADLALDAFYLTGCSDRGVLDLLFRLKFHLPGFGNMFGSVEDFQGNQAALLVIVQDHSRLVLVAFQNGNIFSEAMSKATNSFLERLRGTV